MTKEQQRQIHNLVQIVAEYAASLTTISTIMALTNRPDVYDQETLSEQLTMIERRAAWIADEVAAFRRLQSQSG